MLISIAFPFSPILPLFKPKRINGTSCMVNYYDPNALCHWLCPHSLCKTLAYFPQLNKWVTVFIFQIKAKSFVQWFFKSLSGSVCLHLRKGHSMSLHSTYGALLFVQPLYRDTNCIQLHQNQYDIMFNDILPLRDLFNTLQRNGEV